MRTVVFSDVHGNLPALEAMLAHAGPADRYVSLGDVVNYGPWSEACAERLAALPNCELLMGNHEEAFLSGRYPGSHPVARAFFEFCRPRFTRPDLIAHYRETCRVGAFVARHTLEERYIFEDTDVTCRHDTLIGHSHHAFRRDVGQHLLVNVGSVGQNRKALDLATYAVHGPGPRDVVLVQVRYDAAPVLAEMRRLGYPAICVDYYLGKLSGQAPNSHL